MDERIHEQPTTCFKGKLEICSKGPLVSIESKHGYWQNEIQTGEEFFNRSAYGPQLRLGDFETVPKNCF